MGSWWTGAVLPADAGQKGEVQEEVLALEPARGSWEERGQVQGDY